MNYKKAYTSLEQSKKLAEILPLESADMSWVSNGLGKPFARTIPIKGDPEELCGCWSLAALLDVLPYPQLSKDKLGSGKTGWTVSIYPNDCRYDSCWHDNPVDACCEMIVKLHEQELL